VALPGQIDGGGTAADGAVARLGFDRRRLRPNILISGVEGLAERRWEGQSFGAGETIIGVRDLRQRCVMTTFDPDSLEQDIQVLRRIHREFDGRLALNCYVIREGSLSVGDAVEFLAKPVV
jgi:MOSC domain-containing protein